MDTSRKVINVQRRCEEIHAQFGTSEMANYRIQQMCDAIEKRAFEEGYEIASDFARSLTYEQKLEVAQWIVENNCDTMITGSIAIKERGIDLGREVGDIDILVLTHPDAFDMRTMKLPPLCYEASPYDPNVKYKSYQYRFLGTKIDFLFADDKERGIIYGQNKQYEEFSPIEAIILAKKKVGRSKDRRDIEIIERAIAKGL